MFMLETEGAHPSTLLCLTALQNLADRDFHNILDMGCGNGILAVTAAHLWPTAHVLAADISPKAVEDATTAFARHGLKSRATAIRSDGFSQAHLRENAPYDLICCNLLAGVVTGMAKDMKKCLKPDGYALISGIMAWQATEMEQVYTGLGFEIIDKIADSPWLATTLCHKSDT